MEFVCILLVAYIVVLTMHGFTYIEIETKLATTCTKNVQQQNAENNAGF